MNKIESIQELKNPSYIQPIEINYTQNGIHKRWEAVISHDSVSILLYHKEKNAFIVVKQLRPAVLNANKHDGYMYELCAGIIDKNISDKAIAKEEILEECGYDVPLQDIKKVTSFYTSVGISGALQTLYYAEVHESMHTNNGGGIDQEEIEVIYIPLNEAKMFMFDESYKKTPGMLSAFYWFFENISQQLSH
ncbi:NUDIX hydrolase [Sulfurimonas sp.]